MKETAIHIDDSDVIELDGYKFKVLGFVGNDSKVLLIKRFFGKNYHVTEAYVVKRGHPVLVSQSPGWGLLKCRYSLNCYFKTLKNGQVGVVGAYIHF